MLRQGMLDLHEEEGNAEATKLLIECGEKFDKAPTVQRYVATMYVDGDDPSRALPYLERILELGNRTLDDDAFARRARLELTVDNFEDQ